MIAQDAKDFQMPKYMFDTHALSCQSLVEFFLFIRQTRRLLASLVRIIPFLFFSQGR